MALVGRPLIRYASRLVYASAVPHVQRLLGKRTKYNDLRDVIDAAQAGSLQDGTIVEVNGLLSKYTFDYVPRAAPPHYLVSSPSDIVKVDGVGYEGRVDVQAALTPCGENPPFETGQRLLYLYRPTFTSFPMRVPSGSINVAKLASMYAYVPVIASDDVISSTEKRNNIVARATYLPYEVAAELFRVTKEQYERIKAATLALVVTPEFQEDIKLNESSDRLQTDLWTGLFAEFLLGGDVSVGDRESPFWVGSIIL